MPFDFERLSIPETILIKPVIFKDDRGFFMETYKYSDFDKIRIKEYFVQDNYSKSIKNVLRGLHYQKSPCPQGKLVFCLEGNIFDVADHILLQNFIYILKPVKILSSSFAIML